MAGKSAFRQAMEAAVDEQHCADHPMAEQWARGEVGRNCLMGWAVEQYHWVSNVRRKASARAEAPSTSPASIAARAISTQIGCGSPEDFSDRASVSTDGGRCGAVIAGPLVASGQHTASVRAQEER